MQRANFHLATPTSQVQMLRIEPSWLGYGHVAFQTDSKISPLFSMAKEKKLRTLPVPKED